MLQKPASCVGCPLYGTGKGFSHVDGTGSNGVLIVAEALGESEELAGIPLVGKAGQFLFTHLKRVDLERDDFSLFNAIACRPPGNRLVGEAYEHTALERCAPHLDAAIELARTRAGQHGRTFTILTLGRTAFKRVMGVTDRDPIMRSDYLCYPFWNERYKAWVVAAQHPSYLMRGNTSEIPVLQFAAKRAVEIARNGLQLASPVYLLDPIPGQFAQWCADYYYVADGNPTETFLSYDIETPYKNGKDEAELKKDDDNVDDYTILRISFSYTPNNAVSVPWTAPYLPLIEKLFKHSGAKVGWNNENYDAPRIQHYFPLNGDQIDAMLAWHVLNSALPKGLGFVTPFYAQDVPMWKHLSAAEPAFYNAKDADMALRNWLGIRKDLISTGLMPVFERHVIQLNRVFSYMSQQGVKLDATLRAESEVKLQEVLDAVGTRMAEAVPIEAQQLQVYQKPPKDADTTNWIRVQSTRKTTQCPRCKLVDVKAEHYKSVGKKALSRGDAENPCVGLKSDKVIVPAELWAKPLEFKISNTAMQRYQKAVKHKAIMNVREGRQTFDEKAITKLIKRYPKDPLYPLILEHREHQKLLGTYVGITGPDGAIKGGMPVGRDGRIHTMFTHNPSTLRSASQNPNLQNLPRPQKDPNHPANLIRNLVVADTGNLFYARDYSGIEAVLVGYFAMAPGYIRLAKTDVHSFYTAYALYEQGRFSANDLPLLSWDDDKLTKHLGWIKEHYSADRNNLYKHLVHGANYMQGARGAADTVLRMTGKEVQVHVISKVMEIYFELFPEIRKWHHTLLAQVDKDGFSRNPFGYVHRFYNALSWEMVYGKWQSTPGSDANRVIAFLPQSTAAGIIKEAMLRLYFDRYNEAGQYLRLLVHDELFFEVPEDLLAGVDAVVRAEMERPIPEMALPSSYGMGEYLTVLTEAKKGYRWGSMK